MKKLILITIILSVLSIGAGVFWTYINVKSIDKNMNKKLEKISKRLDELNGDKGEFKTTSKDSNESENKEKEEVKTEEKAVEYAVYRFYDENTGDNLYLTDESKKADLEQLGYTFIGQVFQGCKETDKDCVGIYSLYTIHNDHTMHYYTSDKSYVNAFKQLGYKVDNNGNPAFYVNGKGNEEVYCMYNEQTYAFVLSIKKKKKEHLEQLGYTQVDSIKTDKILFK